MNTLIEFGCWPHFEKGAAEPLTWLVLQERADGGWLLVTRDIIERRLYTESNHNTVWADCDLRTWLSDEFLHIAFSDEERAAIAPVWLETSDNPESGTKGGPATYDSVFLLSRDEAGTVFPDDASRSSVATPHAAGQGCCGNWWWLRSPGEFQSGPDVVLGDGRIYNCSGHYNRKLIGVRPAIVLRAWALKPSSARIPAAFPEKGKAPFAGGPGITWWR